ncbi:MAG: LLM class flavin-dependent oxidoreductase [Cytophagaceae bacterium]|nr:LLM class flavin-dependent oxidoreductase [Cytophagaceae bacterium]
MSHTIKLSVLDQSPIRRGGTAVQALKESVQLAKLADRLGYTRYWVSEHHNTTSLAGSTPEVLIAHLAGETEHLRVGSGGVMLPNHSALKVAENFRMLEALFPGRIDLGIGRAPGTDRITASILNPSNRFKEDDLLQQLIDLQDYLYDTNSPGASHQNVRAIPVTDTAPDLWMLTSSGESGVIAAHFGMGVSFAHFINPVGGPQMIRAYKTRFTPSEQLKKPQASVGIFVFCSEDEVKVKQTQAVMDWQLVNIGKGISNGFPSYEDICSTIYSESELQMIQYNRQRMVVGIPEVVKEKLTTLAIEYDVDEIVIATITYDFADRLKSYELLAELFELKKQ